MTMLIPMPATFKTVVAVAAYLALLAVNNEDKIVYPSVSAFVSTQAISHRTRWGWIYLTSSVFQSQLSSESETTQTSATTPTTMTTQRPASWDERFLELAEFKNKFNHTSVSKRLSEYTELGKWVSRQRQRYKHLAMELVERQQASQHGKETTMARISIDNDDVDDITISRIKRLRSIGFQWDASHMKQEKERQAWWERLDEIRDVCSRSHKYKVEEKGQKISDRHILSIQYPPLATVELSSSQQEWLRRQRRQYDKLDVDQIEALDDFDDTWRMTSRQRIFEIRLRELHVYRMTTGHCDVPISYPNRKLAHWVSNLRKTNNANPGNIDPIQRKRLNSLGFTWKRWADFEDTWELSDMDQHQHHHHTTLSSSS